MRRIDWEEVFGREDPWRLKTSGYERTKYARQLALLRGERYRHALEVGCAEGWFTSALAPRADRITAVDISRRAIRRARREYGRLPNVRFIAGDILRMRFRARSFDLVLLGEAIYFVAAGTTLAGLGDFLARLAGWTRPGATLLVTSIADRRPRPSPFAHLTRWWIVETLHGLLPAFGFRRLSEARFRGTKDGKRLTYLISRYRRSRAPVPPAKATTPEGRG